MLTATSNRECLPMSSLAIKTEGLTKRFGTQTAVNNLTLNIEKGEIFGFLGPNGSGKTTTIRMLCGLLKQNSGRAEILGLDSYKDKKKIRPLIGYMSQKFSLYNDLSACENLDFYAGVYGLRGHGKKEAIKRVLDLTRIYGYENSLAGTLSGGWRQRLALGCAIIHHPEVLFLDEPTSGVDPVSKQIFWDIIYALSHEGVTVLVTTHSMDEAEHCNEIGFMLNSNLIETGKKEVLKASFPKKVLAIRAEDTTALRSKVESETGRILHSYTFGNELRLLIENGEEAQFSAYDYTLLEPSLEDIFVYLANGEEHDAGEA